MGERVRSWRTRRLSATERRILGAALRMAAAESENAHRSSLASTTEIAAENAATMLQLALDQRALAAQIDTEYSTVTVVSPAPAQGARERR